MLDMPIRLALSLVLAVALAAPADANTRRSGWARATFVRAHPCPAADVLSGGQSQECPG